MNEQPPASLPDRMRDHGSYRRDSKDMLNMGAAEIERLETEISRLRTALADCVDQ